MKKNINILLFIILLISCSQNKDKPIKINNNSQKIIKQTESNKNLESKNNNRDFIDKKQADTINPNQIYEFRYPEIIAKLKNKFFTSELNDYDCYELAKFVDSYGKINTEGLYEIDSTNCKKMFGNAKSDYGNFCDSYLYSIERPIMGFYPITVIQGFGVAERPLMLVLFNNEGKYINAIEVADYYGETGGCLKSFFINDSTLIREYEWNIIDEPENTNDEVITTKESEDKVIIHKNGTITVIDENQEIPE